MIVRVWGARGSLSAPGPATVGYGGNTSCVEVELADGTTLILDAGSGIRELGHRLLERDHGELYICLTHLHLDHVEGLGFFAPLWRAGWQLRFWGPPSATTTLRDRVSRYLSPPLFPIGLSEAPAQAVFEDAPREPWLVGSAVIEAQTVEHRGPTLGYRIEEEGRVLVYLPDHEPYLTAALDDEPEWISGWALATGADLLLHDSQYTQEEYGSRLGWGHSTFGHAAAFSRAAGVRQLAMFHHDPMRSDRELEAHYDEVAEAVHGVQEPPLIAREGLEIALSEGPPPLSEAQPARTLENMQICPGCGEENPDKFRVCGFCGTALAAADPQPAEPQTAVCPSCGEENPAKFRLCGFCGSPLAAAPSPSEERKVITAIFVDLVGSTARSENLDPEDVKSLVAPYHARVRGELETHGGTFEKFSGDAILALFGTPKAHEDDPERAIRAALAVRQGIAELNEEDEWLDLHIRTGIHTGEALVMLGARPGEGEWSAAGDVLNTAARIQSAAPTDGILVSRTTYLATMDSFAFNAAEPIQAKGKAEPVEVWEVVSAQEEDGAGRRGETELVGREAELGELTAFLDELLEKRSAGLATIVGSPGVGKSRLLLEFVRRLAERFTVHRGKCLSYGEGITYWPIVEIFKSAAGILQSDDREASAQKLDTFLETLPTDDLDELRTIASALSNLIGIPTTPRGTYVTSEISQAELHWGIRRTLQLLATERPTAVVVEDLHWAEPTLLELLSYLLAEEAGVPLALIATSRPEIEDTAPGFLGRGRRRRTVDLQTLGPEQAAALLGGLTGDPAFADTQFAKTLITNAGGNPLFLEETVRMLREEGLLELERWQSGEMQDVPIPTSVQGLISSRLDRLEPKEKQLAHHASVIGAIFWAGAVARLGAADDAAPDDPGPGLSELERRDFVAHLEVSTVRNDEEYSFNHILMRDVAYGQVPKGVRAQLHLGFTEWVKDLPTVADEFVEIVAWHLEQACLLAREVTRSPIEPPIQEAASMLAEAGGRAERRESLREAHRYYTRALDLLDDKHADMRVTLRVHRADMAMQLGELKEATDELLEVAEQAAELGRTEVEAEALLLLGDIDQRQGRPNDAHRRLLKAEELAGSTDDARLRTRVAFVMNTFVVDYLGELDQPIEKLRAAIATAEALGDPALAAEGHLRIAAPLMSHDLAAAESELQRCLELADDLGSHRIQAEGASWLGTVAYGRNRPEEAERLCLQARTWFERTGDSYFQVQNLVLGLATFALWDGRAEEGEKWLREALPIALQIGGWVLLNTYWHFVQALVAQDRLDDAREIAAFAARGVPEEDPHSSAWLSLTEGWVATAAGERTAAAAAFAEAVRLFEELNYPLDVADARFAFARSLLAFGEVVGARTEFERARSTYVRIGADVRRDAVDAELADLLEGPAPAGPSTA